MDSSKKKGNWVVVSFVFVFAMLFALEIYAQQPSDQRRLPQPLLKKLRGPQWLQERLQARKAQAQKTPPPSADKKACPPNCDELLEKARKYGSVMVIVGLNIPDLPDPFRLPEKDRPPAFQARKEAVDQAQERLLKRMAKYNIANITKFEYSPDLAMTVDAAALEDLISNPEVISIGEDIFKVYL